MARPITFTINKKLHGTLGRAGVVMTPHGPIETPAYVTVGTKATVKALTPEQVKSTGAQVVLANTYHLFLQPGEDIVKEAGGLHAFMNWQGPTITDSGGFQVFSLGEGFSKGVGKFATDGDAEKKDAADALSIEGPLPSNVPAIYDEDLATSHGKLAVIDEEGVTFTSHINGDLHRFIPERSVEIQQALGADIIFAFDECTSPLADHAYQKEAMERTHRWAKRSLSAHRNNIDAAKKQGIFGVIQGGRFEDLRKESAQVLGDMDFDGYGIGGSFSKEDLGKALVWVNTILPEDKPRHLLGIGEPGDLFDGVENGIDTFDCVLPTRLARTGTVYTKTGKRSLHNAQFIRDFTPIEADCPCYTCTHYTKAYLSHLFRAKEMLAATLASIHNLHFLIHLVADIRQSILDDTYAEFKENFLKEYEGK